MFSALENFPTTIFIPKFTYHERNLTWGYSDFKIDKVDDHLEIGKSLYKLFPELSNSD